MKLTTKERLAHKKVVAICRGIYGEDLRNLAAALHRGGIDFMEVTFDQADADHIRKTPEAIKMLKDTFTDMSIGAGTVITLEQLRRAAECGAEFIISPNTDKDIIIETKRLNLISIPGAMTPSEVAAAWNTGADFVKLFPCDQLGSDYVKAIRSPLNHIPLMATGGIDANNLDLYLSIGMAGAGIGGKLCNKQLIKEGKFDELEKAASQCASIAAKYTAAF